MSSLYNRSCDNNTFGSHRTVLGEGGREEHSHASTLMVVPRLSVCRAGIPSFLSLSQRPNEGQERPEKNEGEERMSREAKSEQLILRQKLF